ncbi:MAG: HlyD family type I secretion periplasmic adaptor subunit [Halopseudomonas aestusnigri]
MMMFIERLQNLLKVKNNNSKYSSQFEGWSRGELEFLPAALEVIETPASPTGRWLLYVLLGVVLSAVFWSFIGTVDIVAIGQGKLAPKGGVKVVQSLELGVVRTIKVAEGQTVSKGDVLLTLDPTDSAVDKEQLEREIINLELEINRMKSFLNGARLLINNPEIEHPQKVKIDDIEINKLRLKSELDAYISQVEFHKAEIYSQKKEQDTILSEIERIKALYPMLQDRAKRYKKLTNNGSLSFASWEDAHMSFLEMEFALQGELKKLGQSKAGEKVLKRKLNHYTTEVIESKVTGFAEANEKLKSVKLSLQKAKKRAQNMTLTAPISGRVQELSVKTIGGVVRPADVIMNIVPTDMYLIGEVDIPNKEIGFLKLGQDVAVKVDSFPFTKYGLLKGRLKRISEDAVFKENIGFVYTSEIEILGAEEGSTINNYSLSSGMTISAEIKTGKRRILDFLFSTIKKYQNDALRER